MYLYIFEDGTIRQSQDPPTSHDIECIADGILQVVTPIGGKFSQFTGKFREMEDVPDCSIKYDPHCGDYTSTEPPDEKAGDSELRAGAGGQDSAGANQVP